MTFQLSIRTCVTTQKGLTIIQLDQQILCRTQLQCHNSDEESEKYPHPPTEIELRVSVSKHHHIHLSLWLRVTHQSSNTIQGLIDFTIDFPLDSFLQTVSFLC